MSPKKVFGFLLWFLYSIAVGVSLFRIAGSLCRQAGYPETAGFLGSGVWLALCGLIVFLLHRFMQKANIFWEPGSTPALVSEGVAAVILLGLGMLLRISFMDCAGQDAAYYELAMVAEGQTIPPVVHGATYVYLQLLHTVYVIFGNIFLAGIWLQIVLQLIACSFFYAAVRKQAGAVAALAAFGFIMLEPVMVREALTLSPRMLFLAVFAIAACFCVRGISARKHSVRCVICGVLISFVVYLDIAGLSLLFMTVAGLLFQNEEEETPFAKRLVGGLCCAAGCAAGFVLLVLLDSLASSKTLSGVMEAWWSLFTPSGFAVLSPADEVWSTVSMLLLVMAMCLGIFSYWCNRRRESFSMWSLAGLTLVLIQCFGMTTAETFGYPQIYAVAAILAGIGLSGLLQKDIEALMYERLETELELMSLDIAAEASSEKDDAAAPCANAEIQQSEPSRVKLLENPLPLPKKHVRKTLDFDIEPDEEQNDFDIKVDENDDYDI